MKEAVERLIDDFENMVKEETEFRAYMMKKYKADGENNLGRIQALNYAIHRLKEVVVDAT